VQNVNLAPSFVSTITDTTVSVGQNLRFVVIASDPDNEPLTFQTDTLAFPSGAEFVTSTQLFSWTPTETQIETDSILFIVTDGSGAADSLLVVITVVDSNNPPVLDTLADTLTVNINNLLQFVVSAEDPEQHRLSFRINNLPEGAEFDTVTKVFSWVPVDSQLGFHSINVKVSDKFSKADSQIVVIRVIDENIAPVFCLIDTQYIYEDSMLIISILAEDENQDTLTYPDPKGMPEGAQFNKETSSVPVFVWQPTYNDSGLYVIEFKVEDPSGLCDTMSVVIKIFNKNRPPTISIPEEIIIDEDSLLILDLNAQDLDGDAMTINVTGLPAGARIDSAGEMRFLWRPTFAQYGTYSLTFIISDDRDSGDPQSVVITVQNVNWPPEDINAIAPLYGEEIDGTNYLVWKKSVDPDSDDTVWYHLQIDDEIDFTEPEIDADTIMVVSSISKVERQSRSHTVAALMSINEEGIETVAIQMSSLQKLDSLNDDNMYFWRVQAFDTWGDTSNYTKSTNYFTWNIENSAPKAVSSGFHPEEGTVAKSLNPTVTWDHAEDPDQSDNIETLHYILEIDDNNFQSDALYRYVSVNGKNSITITDTLDDDHQWYYRIKTVDDDGAESDWSRVMRFYTNSQDDPPEPFNLIMPLNQASIDPIPAQLFFSWEKTQDSDPGSFLTYGVEVASDSTFKAGSIVLTLIDIPGDSNSVEVLTAGLPHSRYYWRVCSWDNTGLRTFSRAWWSFDLGVLTGINEIVRENGIPETFHLEQNYPNPFNSKTVIRYGILKPCNVNITIYNSVGQKVTTLVKTPQSPGWYSVAWDGKDGRGIPVASGTYMYQIRAGGFLQSKKMIYLK